MNDQTHIARTQTARTHAARTLSAWLDRISSELKGAATVEDLGVAITPDIHVAAAHMQAPPDSGVHDQPRSAMRYEPLVGSVDQWQTLRSLDPDIGGTALVFPRLEDDGEDATVPSYGNGRRGHPPVDVSDSGKPAEINVYVPPDSGMRVVGQWVSSGTNDRPGRHAGLLIDPLAVALLSHGDDAANDEATDDSIRMQLLEQGSECPVIGCVDAFALGSAGAAAPTLITWSLLSLSAWLDVLDVGDLEAGGRLERIRILAPVGNRPVVDAAVLTATRDLASALIRLYARANGGPEHPVVPELHAISSRSAVVRSAAPADDAGNLVRSTLQAVAAASAGADILSLLPYDEHRSPDADSIRLSSGIHRMLRHESGLHRTTQPLAGSYAFETIVRKISDPAWSRFVELTRQGSPGDGVRSGLVDKWIREDQGATGHPVRVGLDKYVPDSEEQVS